MFENSWVWLVAAIVTVGVAALVGYLVYQIVWYRRFVAIFKFTPERDWQLRLIKQPRVDLKLSQLAYEFKDVSKAEGNLLERYYNRKEARNQPSEEDLPALKHLRKTVALAKKAFWRAHKAARIAKFQVDKKYTDYL